MSLDHSDNVELPEGWTALSIGACFDLNPPKPKADTLHSGTQVSFVPMPAVDAEKGAITGAYDRSFGECRSGYTSFADGDVIMAKITPCMENGKAAIVRGLTNGIGAGSTEFHVMRPTGSVLAEYLFHYIRQPQFRSAAESEMTGSVGQKRVPADIIRNAPLPVPPLSEQRRIVAAIDALQARLDAARASLGRVPAILKRFRQSVLAAACSGRLTEDWREQNPTTESGDQLLQRILDERRARWTAEGRRGKYIEPEHPDTTKLPELPEGWAHLPINAISDCLDNLRRPINAEDRAKRIGEIPYYGANGQVGWIDDFLFDEELVLVVEDETFIGREKPFSYQIDGKTWVNNHAHVLRPSNHITAGFLNILLSYYDFVPLTSGSTGRRKLNQGALMNALVAVPPLSEQAAAMAAVTQLFALGDGIAKRVQSSSSKIARLKQSALDRAFRGELVPTDAELAH